VLIVLISSPSVIGMEVTPRVSFHRHESQIME